MKIHINPIFFGIVGFLCIVDHSFLPLAVIGFSLIHECAHLLAMKVLSYDVAAFEIKPFGFSIHTTSKYKNYTSDIFVALAGPLANLFVAAVITVLYVKGIFFKNSIFYIAVNLMLFLLNICPIEFLDGGRILKSILYKHFLPDAADKIASIISLIFIGALLILGAYIFIWADYNFTLLLIGIYLLVILLERLR